MSNHQPTAGREPVQDDATREDLLTGYLRQCFFYSRDESPEDALYVAQQVKLQAIPERVKEAFAALRAQLAERPVGVGDPRLGPLIKYLQGEVLDSKQCVDTTLYDHLADSPADALTIGQLRSALAALEELQQPVGVSVEKCKPISSVPPLDELARQLRYLLDMGNQIGDWRRHAIGAISSIERLKGGDVECQADGLKARAERLAAVLEKAEDWLKSGVDFACNCRDLAQDGRLCNRHQLLNQLVVAHAPTFTPYASDEPHALTLYIKGDADFSEQVDDRLTLMRSLETQEIVGVRITRKEKAFHDQYTALAREIIEAARIWAKASKPAEMRDKEGKLRSALFKLLAWERKREEA